MSPSTSCGLRVVPCSMRDTRTRVGGTTGRPSVQSRAKQASCASSLSPIAIARDSIADKPLIRDQDLLALRDSFPLRKVLDDVLAKRVARNVVGVELCGL